MNWADQPGSEGQPGAVPEKNPRADHPLLPGEGAQPDGAANPSQNPPSGGKEPVIRIGKRLKLAEGHGKEMQTEVYTMTLGTETIELLPLKNWGQLDVYKWRVRGKLPGTPAGLEITPDHVKMAGETVLISDPEGCPKIERLVEEWLTLERENLALFGRAHHAMPLTSAQAAASETAQHALHFQVAVDKRGQVHIQCLQGKEVVGYIGLNVAGFNSLVSQGLMSKPRKLEVGALHDWIQLDDVLCSFEKGNDDSAKLEKLLNEHYIPASSLGQGKDVVIFANPASSTGFDIQFPVQVAGIVDHRRRPLNEDTLAILQDPEKCGLLHKEIIIKLTRPSLIFKHKTPDGGERYLESGPENTVAVSIDGGVERLIDLSQPVNCNRLSAVELTAVFNHPAINRHSKLRPLSVLPHEGRETIPTAKQVPASPPPATPSAVPQAGRSEVRSEIRKPVQEPAKSRAGEPLPNPPQNLVAPEKSGQAAPSAKPLPNDWLKDVLAQEPIRHDWFACLAYSKIAERFGNSTEGRFGPSACWFVALGEAEDIGDPAFTGVFLTEKSSLGFLGQGWTARFHNGVAFIGDHNSPLEGIAVGLLALGLDANKRVVFVVTDNYRSKFGVPEPVVAAEMTLLKQHGAVVLSMAEVLVSHDPIEVVWTVPAQQENLEDPQARESRRPAEFPS